MKIIIIGSCVAGSVLARTLPDEGYNVVVLEKSKRAGGMCKSYYYKGFTYEYGPHILANHHASIEVENFIKKSFSENSLDNMDLLLYPSNYGVGVRTKILHAFSKKCLVCTTYQSKNGVPELKNNYNCIITRDVKSLTNSIIDLALNKKYKIDVITKNAYNFVKTKHNYKSISKKLVS